MTKVANELLSWSLSMTVFFFLDNIGVNAMYITVKKIKHNKIDKGGEGEEGGFKPQAIMF